MLHDSNGNVKTVTDAAAGQNQASYSYNANGTVATATDFRGATTSYAYDSGGNLTKVTPPSPLGAVTIVPDSLSRPQSVTNGNGVTTTYTYDNLDRVTQVQYPNDAVFYYYDFDDNVYQMNDGTQITSWTYDARNRQTKKTLPSSSTISYGYDAASNLTAYTDAGGTVTYGYNQVNELTSLTDPHNAQTTFGYDANGHRTTTSYPNGVTMTAAQRLNALTAAKAGGPMLLNYTYSFNNPSYVNPSGNHDTGLVNSIADAVANTTTAQGYAALNRLMSWVVTPGPGSPAAAHNYQYAYDGNSNRTSINADGTTSTLGYNAANEWTTDTAGGKTATYTWDGAGNELGNDGFGDPTKALAITYNDRNQTASVTDTQQNVVPMTYSGPGQAERVSAGWAASNPLTPGGPASYTTGALGLASATDSTGAAYYTRDPGGTLISQRLANGTTNYFLFDGQGNVVRLVDSSGTVVATYFYCPTGNDAEPPSGPAAAGNPYRKGGNFYEPATKTNGLPDGTRVGSSSSNATQLAFGPLEMGNIAHGLIELRSSSRMKFERLRRASLVSTASRRADTHACARRWRRRVWKACNSTRREKVRPAQQACSARRRLP